MNKRLISTLTTISSLIPLPLYLRIMHRDVIDFFWHVVSDDLLPHVRHLYPIIPSKEFENALQYLKRNFTFINYSQLHSYIFDGVRLPPNAVHISFDDGYTECFEVVRPLLLKYEIPCTFFLTTDLINNTILFYRNKQSLCIERFNQTNFDFRSSINKNLAFMHYTAPNTHSEFISWFKDLRLPDEPLIDEICRIIGVDWQSFLKDKQPYLTSGQVRQMHAEGFTIGSHTTSHRKLVDLSSDEIETEISESTKIIADMTGQDIVPFSFPHSAWGLDRNHLAKIRTRYPKIGLLFDTKGLHPDVDFIHNRVWAERPLPNISRTETGGIKEHLTQAYQGSWVDAVMTVGRSLRR